jgi:hypothetical protein
VDYNPALIRARRKLAMALAKYADRRGWHPEDYKIFMRANPDWNRLHVAFVAKEFENSDKYQCYLDVLHYLEGELTDESELLDSINLVVRDFKQVEEGGFFGLGPEYSEEATSAGS